MSGPSNELKVLCPFCNAIQSAEVVYELDSIHAGCETCGFGGYIEGVVEVNCSSCHRVIYRKETR